jgi:hypothetical protein
VTASPRHEIKDRPGTKINHAVGEPVFALKPKGRGQELFGYLDRSADLFQSGGEAGNFIYWRENLVTLPIEVWNYVKDRAAWIELVDHRGGRCFRIATRVFAENAQTYNAGAGFRIGCPRPLWQVEDGPAPPLPPQPRQREPQLISPMQERLPI